MKSKDILYCPRLGSSVALSFGPDTVYLPRLRGSTLRHEVHAVWSTSVTSLVRPPPPNVSKMLGPPREGLWSADRSPCTPASGKKRSRLGGRGAAFPAEVADAHGTSTHLAERCTENHKEAPKSYVEVPSLLIRFKWMENGSMSWWHCA